MGICVGGSRNCTYQERLPWHAEEPNVEKQLVWKIFTSWFGTYCIYLCCFFKIWWKSKEASCMFSWPCFAFLSDCYGLSGNNIANIQYFWGFLDIQIKYGWKSIISFLKHRTQHKIHFALQYWWPFFHQYSYQEYGLFFRFVGS